MLLKLVGLLLLVCCGAIWGLKQLRDTVAAIESLDALDGALSAMEAEINLCLRPLPDIFSRLSSGKLGEIFREMAENCDIMSAGEAWGIGIEAIELPREAHKGLERLSGVLGLYDAQRQSREIRSVRDALRGIRSGLLREKETKKHHYPLLGACFAGIVAMIII